MCLYSCWLHKRHHRTELSDFISGSKVSLNLYILKPYEPMKEELKLPSDLMMSCVVSFCFLFCLSFLLVISASENLFVDFDCLFVVFVPLGNI